MTDVAQHISDDHQDPTAGPTWFIGLMGAVLLVVTVLGTAALYYNVKAEEVQDQVVAPPHEEVAALRREQQALLEGPPGWVERDVAGETVRAYVIPIERAMDLVIQETNDRQGDS